MIDYVHFPQLGIESDQRQDLDAPGARQELFDRYDKTTLRSESATIDEVSRLMAKQPSVLVCMESHHRECHRSRLAAAVSAVSGLPTQHLEFAG
jgi:uncharacterized protein (DUF488 family)